MEATRNSYLYWAIKKCDEDFYEDFVEIGENSKGKEKIKALSEKYRKKKFKELGSYISEKNIMGAIIGSIKNRNKIFSKVKKSSYSVKESKIRILLDDEEEFIATVKGAKEQEHMVSCVGGIFRCTCEDFRYRCIDSSGESICKHIYKILKLYKDDIYGEKHPKLV